jgi:predicted amidohydrolase
MASVLDGMPLLVFWEDDEGERVDYDYLLIHEPSSEGRAQRCFRCPDDATTCVLRTGVRWTATGRAEFSMPEVTPTAPPPSRIHRIAVAAEKPKSGNETLADNVEQYLALAEDAADYNPDLLVMPEIILQWGLPGPAFDHAVRIPGPEIDAFGNLAREHEMMITFSAVEEDGDLFYNTMVVLAPDGDLFGTYRKTHLAIGEGWDGTTPGDELPVVDTPLGKVGCTICKDSSLLDSTRVPAERGIEMMLLSIMGDHRAVEWQWAPGSFSPDRWKTIMRARAIENHIWMVIARNNCEGSCIISPSGDILAWNDGRQRVIVAECDLGEELRTFRGSTFRDSTWAERRPHLYR